MTRWSLPAPFADELFSGWLVRSALTLGCDPLILTGELWPKWRPWTIDLDRGIDSERMVMLEKATGLHRETVEAMMLSPTASLVSGADLAGTKAVWPWMLALGTRNRKRSGGLQYCPRCFDDDSHPYYRLSWRFVWHTGCQKHGCLLADRCGACHAPLEPHRLDALDGIIALCSRCRDDLRRTETGSFHLDALKFQAAADQVVRVRQGKYGDQVVSACAWFELSRFFITLLRRSSFGLSLKLNQFLTLLGVESSSIPALETGLSLEMLPVQERSQLFALVWPMIQAGPPGFLAAAKQSQISIESLHDRRFKCPVALQDILPLLANAGPAISRTPADVQDVSPRSRRAVMRMMARLQRKYHGRNQ